MKAYIYFFGFLALLAMAYAATVECPEVDTEYPTHLPNPTDCGSFYKCLNGQAHWQDCPGNLEWNAEADYCDWPWLANCEVTAEAPEKNEK